MSIVVTGGAGFIGSNIIKLLNDKGYSDVLIVDHISDTDKWKNILNKEYTKYITKQDFLNSINTYNIEMILHLGACSSTTERDFDYLIQNNLEYSKLLWNICVENNIPFIYASSAATYGDGSIGFDDTCDLNTLRPLNGYGYSKHLFDLWVKKQHRFPKQYVGLKFFNVYGPNEYCKGSMASMVFHGFHQIKKEGQILLFKSEHPDYEDGGQLRDFIYVKDICHAIDFFIEHQEVNGLFNLGTGKARSFRELAEAIFYSLGKEANIKYISMPDHLKNKYQYFTEAKMDKLYSKGYKGTIYTLEEGINDYVHSYLLNNNDIN